MSIGETEMPRMSVRCEVRWSRAFVPALATSHAQRVSCEPYEVIGSTRRVVSRPSGGH